MENIFDPEHSKLTRVDLYRSYVIPDLYPAERPARAENWSAEDRAAFCGGEYVKESA